MDDLPLWAPQGINKMNLARETSREVAREVACKVTVKFLRGAETLHGNFASKFTASLFPPLERCN